MTTENYIRIELFFQPGPTLSAKIMRHLSPRTFTKIVTSLPMEGPIRRVGGFIMALLNLNAPFDKTKDFFEKGEIAYQPKTGAICIATERTQAVGMAPLGNVEDIELLSDIGTGGWLRIRRLQ